MVFSPKAKMLIMKYVLFSLLASSLLIASCGQENTSSVTEVETPIEEIDTIDYLKEGQQIATQSQMVLGQNLMKAIKSRGTEYAVGFCSNEAIHLTDSMALELNAKVKRVSDKHRNPNNKANEEELAYIEQAKTILSEGKTIKPQLSEVGNKRIGYYPILTDKRCMQCHGMPESEISPTTLSKLSDLYPNDLAKGYAPEQLRGIWVVEMDKAN